LSTTEQIQKNVNDLTDDEAVRLMYDWYGLFARKAQQIPEGDWFIWFILAGRGWGKTRSGAEWIRYNVENNLASRIALVAPTAPDARDIMIEGESGLLAISSPWCMPKYESSKRRLTWPNGAIATAYSSEIPDRLNGPQHDLAWSDEIGVWKYGRETWDMLQFGLRLGDNPKQIITSTPKVKNITLIKEILAEKLTVLSTGTTYENRPNLAKPFFDTVVKKYEGTRLGSQELHAKILDDVPGALWKRKLLEETRVPPGSDKIPRMKRIVVALDPEASDTETSSHSGIIVAGLGEDNQGYCLSDLTKRGSPKEWGLAAISGYHTYDADRMIGEVNNGGDMVEYVIKSLDTSIPFKQIRASRGKYTRAEPVAALHEQKRIHLVGNFPDLEDQLCSWTPDSDVKNDRLDAFVWAFTELMLQGSGDWSKAVRTGTRGKQFQGRTERRP